MLNLNTFTGGYYYKEESGKQELSSYASDATYAVQNSEDVIHLFLHYLALVIYGTYCIFFGVYWIIATILKKAYISWVVEKVVKKLANHSRQAWKPNAFGPLFYWCNLDNVDDLNRFFGFCQLY